METFLGLAKVSLDDVPAGAVVIIGAPEATPYETGRSSHAGGAPCGPDFREAYEVQRTVEAMQRSSARGTS